MRTAKRTGMASMGAAFAPTEDKPSAAYPQLCITPLRGKVIKESVVMGSYYPRQFGLFMNQPGSDIACCIITGHLLGAGLRKVLLG